MKQVKNFLKTFISYLFLFLLYIVPWTFLMGSQRFIAFLLMFILTITFFSIDFYKGNFDNYKKLKINEYLNLLSLGIIITISFILILKLIPAKFTYYNQFYYLNIYEYMPHGLYVLIAGIFLPFIECSTIKKLSLKHDNKIVKYFLIGLTSLVIAFVQPYFIYGIFFGVISFITSMIIEKSQNIQKGIIFEIFTNIIYCFYMLCLSEYKLAIIGCSIFVFIITIIVNTLILAKNK